MNFHLCVRLCGCKMQLFSHFIEPSYEWLYPNQTVTMGNTLIINDPIKRNDTGIYRCRARNKHGDRIAETLIDVQCKFSF